MFSPFNPPVNGGFFHGLSAVKGAQSTPLSELADIYIDADTAFAGTVSAVGDVSAGGGLELVLADTGSGAEITKEADGFRFHKGKYLRWTGAGATWRGALVVADVTLHGNPTGTGMILLLENDLNSRQFLRYVSGGAVSGLGPNQNVKANDFTPAFGTRQTVAFLVDRDQQHLMAPDEQAFISADGYLEGEPGTPPMADIVLNDIRVGSGCDMTLHELAVFGMPVGGSLAVDPLVAWHKIKGVPRRVYSATSTEVFLMSGQSLAVGPTTTPAEREPINFQDRYGVLRLAGLDRSDGADVTIIGPSTLGYNEAMNASGIVPCRIANNLMLGMPAALALNQLRSNGSPAILTGFGGYAGERIDDFDSDPLTGSGQTFIYENDAYWIAQAVAEITATGKTPVCHWLAMIQGHGDKTRAAGVWRAGFENWWSDLLALVQAAIPGADPGLVLAQTGGDLNTSNDLWHNKAEQLDLATEGRAHLVPIYPYLTNGDGIHPSVGATLEIADTFSWAMAEVEAGRTWNILRPAAALDGNTLTLTFALQPGETLVAYDGAKYGGAGISDLGFEVDGATIAGVSVAGSQATITCDAPPTHWRYAMQSQDLTGASLAYPAHRGLLRTSKTLTGPQSGKTLYRWVPSLGTVAV